MHNRLWIAAVLAAAPILALSPMAFPRSHDAGCATSPAETSSNRRLFSSLMRQNDAVAERQLARYHVTRVKSWDVRSISDRGICERAATAYARVLHEEAQGRKVHILRVGDRYIVVDAGYRTDDSRRAVTFDSTFRAPLAVVTE